MALCPRVGNVEDHGIREIKDSMSREILRDLGSAGITVASATVEVVGVPPVSVALRRE